MFSRLTRESRPAPRIEPISEELRVLRVTVGRDFVADLESVRAALSHQIPDGTLEKILHECLRRTLRECERRRPFAKGGESTVSNLTLICSRHNRFLADQDYGSEHMARVVSDRRATRADSSAQILVPHETSTM